MTKKKNPEENRLQRYKWKAIGTIIAAVLSVAWCSQAVRAGGLAVELETTGDLLTIEQTVTKALTSQLAFGDTIRAEQRDTIRALRDRGPETIIVRDTVPGPAPPPDTVPGPLQIDSFPVPGPATVDTLWLERSPVFADAAADTMWLPCEAPSVGHAPLHFQTSDVVVIVGVAVVSSLLTYYFWEVREDDGGPQQPPGEPGY